MEPLQYGCGPELSEPPTLMSAVLPSVRQLFQISMLLFVHVS